MQIGASLSHTHLKYLNLKTNKALNEFKKLSLTWVRLSIYWNKIEKEKGKYNFSEIQNILNFCDKNNIKVILSVGMKAQRYPEYYLPSHLENKISPDITRKISHKENSILLDETLKFINKTVTVLKKHKCIKVWQVENEPLDPSGPNWYRLDPKFLEQEVKLVRKLDQKRKILINLWGNELSVRKTYKEAIKLADIVGLDIYLRHPLSFLNFFTKYIGPIDSQKKIKEIGQEIKNAGKEFWIVELQSEPWEPNKLVSESDNPPSFTPKQLGKNFTYAKDLEPDVILFWGFEYWIKRKALGDSRYWEEAQITIKNNL